MAAHRPSPASPAAATLRLPARRLARRPITFGAILVVVGLGWGTAAPPATIRAAPPDDVSIFGATPATLDPAAQGDVDSAAVTAQLYESLTALDPTLTVRPALAASWDIADAGRQISFHLRPGLTFSDGSSLTAADVVRSWLRLIEPGASSPLASLLGDVVGATAYLRGTTAAASVGLKASGNDVEVSLTNPASDFVSVVAGPSFGIVPATGSFGTVVSGAYRIQAQTSDEITLAANDRYWAGTPAIRTVHLKTSIGGRSPVDAFQSGDLDYTPISGFDASWIAYDAELGRQLRSVPSLSVAYLGFDTVHAPFDDVRVRQAFALAVDWQRLVALGGEDTSIPGTGMVPPGIPGRSAHDYAPHQDVAAARGLLAAAGYPGGAGLPAITYVSGGLVTDPGMLRQLHDVLGVTVTYETLDTLFTRLADDPPAMWSLGWVADYPSPNDFLGILLGTGVTNNYGRWSSDPFDAAVNEAGAATTPSEVAAAYERAQAIVQRDVPVIPVSYGPGWALSRTSLLGAGQNGLGFLRLAGLAWQQ